MAPGETYVDYAAALRDLCGSNGIKERVLLEQFYRSIDRTTRALGSQYRPKIKTLEATVEKATNGEHWTGVCTAPNSYTVPANGTTGQMAIIPGVTSAVLDEEEQLSLFTNPREVYNKYMGLSEEPRGWTWDGSI
ncbi:hypothetical protein PHMEG_0004599 [Phytophthora megakarya]|uniref:Uncharacterized protein n=1 Tax=Phytophthora megakarya TaxID=4795 RepID=A0A225WTF5_9STRA|nr:hypothetical protein PHMEG_0004599 [Phytophthora megakarya]